MTQRLQPFRDETVRDPTQLRVRLNDAVEAINAQRGQWRAVRIPDVTTSTSIVLASPRFTVGAVVLGGVNATQGGAAPTSAPWVSNWTQLPDGRIQLSIGGLPTSLSAYSVNLVLFEAEAAS